MTENARMMQPTMNLRFVERKLLHTSQNGFYETIVSTLQQEWIETLYSPGNTREMKTEWRNVPVGVPG
jgi:hypothetical protein